MKNKGLIDALGKIFATIFVSTLVAIPVAVMERDDEPKPNQDNTNITIELPETDPVIIESEPEVIVIEKDPEMVEDEVTENLDGIKSIYSEAKKSNLFGLFGDYEEESENDLFDF